MEQTTEAEGWIAYVGQALELIRQYPLGILVLGAVLFAVYQTRRIRELYTDKERLVRLVFRLQSQGAEFDDEAEQTMIGMDRRKKRNGSKHRRREGE